MEPLKPQPRPGADRPRFLSRLFNRRAARGAAVAVFAAAAVFYAADAGRTDASDKIVLKAATFKDLPGWDKDRQGEAMEAFAKSCGRILKVDPATPMGPRGINGKYLGGKYKDWQPACKALELVDRKDDAAVRAYLEKWFRPWSATAGGTDDKGLFTGYYEPALHGSRTKDATYTVPVFKNPGDTANKSPYWERRDIMTGKWTHDDQALAFVDDVVDLVILQIQGSGRIALPDGTFIRVEYDGTNGRPYYAIGRELVKRGHMKIEDVTMQNIRAWLKANPAEAMDILFTDKSYVFFKEVDRDSGPMGAEGVVLTPERSMAVDKSQVPYGVPLWLDIEPPTPGDQQINRLVVAQDTGGAITGAVRGDFFWGFGPKAEFMGGHMKAHGHYWLLLPKQLDPEKKPARHPAKGHKSHKPETPPVTEPIYRPDPVF
jgi:membrane-bound lytic murein transglycosylase A